MPQQSARCAPPPEFDAAWYTSQYPDCLATRLSPVDHFNQIGRMLGRSPLPPPQAQQPLHAAGPKVSVLCITYNHEKYIEATLDGFCRQVTDFDVEFIVADDCSTDGTQAIIKRYAARDRRIVPILHRKNLGVAGNFESAAARAKGTFVALCEGDDYWTDPTKLQQQVEQMEGDPDLSIVFHPVEVFNDADGRFEYIYPAQKPDLTIWELIHENYIQTNSVMYRWRFQGGLPDWFDSSMLPLDWFLHLSHAERGKIGYLPRIMAKYRKHDAGIWSSAAKDPLQLRRKYGRQQLRLFRAVSSVAGGLFSDYTRHVFDGLLEDIFQDALNCDNTTLLQQLAEEHEADLIRLGYVEKASAEGEAVTNLLDRISARTRISVVVLTYNHEQYTEQCLAGVLQQKGQFELEVIVGDDHSPDDTVKKVEAIARQHSNVKVLKSATNIGMLQNMKSCLDACTGEFIAFCEGDDYWLGDRKLIRQTAILKRRTELAFVFNWVLLQHEQDGHMIPHPEQGMQSETIPTSLIAQNPLTANFSCCVYRAQAVRSIPDDYYRQKGNADWMFNMHVAEWGGITFLKELHSVYRLHSKGQWTGLSQGEQTELFEKAQQHCSQMIGPARGFDDYKVACFVEREHSADLERFEFNLDQPADGQVAYLESGAIRVSGWVIDKLGKPVSIRIGKGNNALVAPANQARLDAARAVSANTMAFHSPMCGFSLTPKFDMLDNALELTFLVDDEEFHFATLKMMLTPG